MTRTIAWHQQPDGAYTATVGDWALTAWWDTQDQPGWAYRAKGPELGQEESGPAENLEDARRQAEACLPR